MDNQPTNTIFSSNETRLTGQVLSMSGCVRGQDDIFSSENMALDLYEQHTPASFSDDEAWLPVYDVPTQITCEEFPEAAFTCPKIVQDIYAQKLARQYFWNGWRESSPFSIKSNEEGRA